MRAAWSSMFPGAMRSKVEEEIEGQPYGNRPAGSDRKPFSENRLQPERSALWFWGLRVQVPSSTLLSSADTTCQSVPIAGAVNDL